jgi:hypothetical protein
MLGSSRCVLSARGKNGAPMRTSDFVSTLGVNTHIGSTGYNNPTQLDALLSYLGINNVRQSSPIDSAGFNNIKALGQLGAKIDLIINGGGPVNLAGAMQNVHDLAPYLNAVENVNEVNIWPISYGGFSGVDAAVALQKDLYAAVRGDSALNGVPVYMFTIGGADPAAFPSIGDLSAYTDYANIHSYPPHGLRPIFVIHAAIDGGRTDAPSKPVVITETGFYTTNAVGWGGLPETMQANYILGEVLDEASAGVSRTYLYDLIDDGADPGLLNQEDHFGLFHFDGSPKLSAIALHNLTTILTDPGAAAATFTPTAFYFTAMGVPYNYTGNTMELDKSDGSHLIAVWNEEQLWNTDTQTTMPAIHYPVTVTLDSTYHSVLVFDPTVGTAPVQTLTNVAQVSLDLVDHPYIIQVLPNAPIPPVLIPPVVVVPPVTVTPPVPPSPPTTAGGLVIGISEDAWQGDAQYVVSVDSTQIGGARTATASHAAGQAEQVSLGMLTGGLHTIGIRFLNDAYGGSANTDRNLYVTGASYDGQSIPGSTIRLLSNGTAAFPVAVSGVVVAPPVTTAGLVIGISEDAWQGDAQYVIDIDSVQLGGIHTATASYSAGQLEQVSLGSLSAGLHTVGIRFINDAYGGSGDTDRNLYVGGASYNGQTIPGGTARLLSNGAASFQVTAGAAPVTTSTAITSTLTLNISEDSWQGDAQFTVKVDGIQKGGTYTATAPHVSGASQAFTIAGIAENFSPHDIAVSFLNDAFGGTVATDRNLYVNSLQFDGVTVAGSTNVVMNSAGIKHFTALTPTGWTS